MRDGLIEILFTIQVSRMLQPLMSVTRHDNDRTIVSESVETSLHRVCCRDRSVDCDTAFGRKKYLSERAVRRYFLIVQNAFVDLDESAPTGFGPSFRDGTFARESAPDHGGLQRRLLPYALTRRRYRS